MSGYRNPCTLPERVLHRLAFGSVSAQLAAADVEDRLYARRIDGIAVERPVFITSLPRTGTTLLLELLAGLPDFVTHTYRDMPFVLTPLLWDAVSRRFRKAGGVMQRAHGDGMTVGYDSPEAFEELLWHSFWPGKYRTDRIVAWRADDEDAAGEFEEFIRNHMRKLLLRAGDGADHRSDVADRRSDVADRARYVSKNNANIARIGLIRRIFPDAVILIPFRSPLDHAASMLRQHRNFLDIHRRDDFSRRYMEYTGHFDFGGNLRPIDLGGWLDGCGADAATDVNFWLEYWCVAFEHVVADHVDHACAVSYDRCCVDPRSGLRRIAKAAGVRQPDALVGMSGRFRKATHYDAEAYGADTALLARGEEVHRRLLEVAVNQVVLPDS